MSPEARATLAGLTRLRSEIEGDRAALLKRAADAREVLGRWQGTPPSREWLTLGAVALHAWYTGLETCLERVARTIDGDVPRGDTAHRDLLSQAMVELSGLRPAVLDRALEDDLLALLSFRQFFRHAYAVELDPLRLRANLELIERVAPPVMAALDSFDAFLARALQGMDER